MTPADNPSEVEVVARAIFTAAQDGRGSRFENLSTRQNALFLGYAQAAIQALDAYRATALEQGAGE